MFYKWGHCWKAKRTVGQKILAVAFFDVNKNRKTLAILKLPGLWTTVQGCILKDGSSCQYLGRNTIGIFLKILYK